MSELIQIKLNQPEKVTDWRDEDGCKERGTGFLFNKYKISWRIRVLSYREKSFVNFGHGPQILRNSLKLGGETYLFDSKNKRAIYKPIAVLYHLGDVEGKNTFGHYKTDILDLHGNWFRTSDEDIPRRISERNVSDQGYIYLYRKIQ